MTYSRRSSSKYPKGIARLLRQESDLVNRDIEGRVFADLKLHRVERADVELGDRLPPTGLRHFIERQCVFRPIPRQRHRTAEVVIALFRGSANSSRGIGFLVGDVDTERFVGGGARLG